MSASQQPQLQVVFCWHMHQPYYKGAGKSDYHLPWVYLHGIKDYADMAAHLEDNPEAKAVVNFAPVLLEQIDDYVVQLEAWLERGTLRISVATTAHYFAPKLLSIFYDRYPGVDVKLDVTNRESLIAQLENNEVDLVVMGRPPDEIDVEAGEFMENPLVLIAPANHPFSREKSIQINRLQGEVFLVREQGSGTRKAMEVFFKQHGVPLKTGMEVSSDEAIKQSVQAGLGLGIMSREAVQNELALGHLIVPDVLHFPLMRHWYVMHRKGKRLSPIAEAFKTFLLEEAATILTKEAEPVKISANKENAPQYEPAKPQNVLTAPDGTPIPPAPSRKDS